MATLEDIVVGVGVDDSDVTKGTRQVEGKFDKLWSNVGKAAGVAGAAIGGALAVGMAKGIQREAGQDLLAAQINLDPAQQETAGRIAGGLYADAWGESLTDVNNTFAAVFREIGDVGEEELGRVTEHAQRFADVFAVDSAAAVKTAGALVKNQLAPDMAGAFDVITAAAQEVNIPAEELLDNLNEYAEPLGSIGVDGPTAIGLMNAAMAAGVRDVDKALDAVKEFSIRSIDGSEATGEAYKTLGLDAGEMAAQIAAGGPAAAGATSQIIQALMGVEDPLAQDAAGVALFGTMWEDLGPKAIAALDPMAAGMVDVTGRSEGLDDAFDNNAAKIETWKRQAEGWLVDLAAAPGALGAAGAGVAGFGAVAASSGADLGGMAQAVTGLGKVGSKLHVVDGVKKLGSLGMAALVAGGNAAKAAGMFVLSGARMVATMAVTAARVVAGWVLMAIQSLLNAARMAIAWLIALGPIGIIIAIVIAVVALIILNWEKILAFTKMIFNAVWSFLKGLWDKVVGFIGAAIGFVKDIFFRFHPVGIIMRNWGPILGFITGLWDKVLGLVKSIPGRIVSALGNVGRMLFDAGKNIIQGLLDGIGSMIKKVQDTISNVAQTVRDFLPFSPAKRGPLSGSGSPFFSGQAIATMLAEGINSSTPKVTTASSKMAAAAAEMLAALRSGKTFFEDFSFRGMSDNADLFNEKFMDQFHGPFTRKGVDSFLSRFAPMASGGLVTGPTLALLGEGGMEEAVIPLPRGIRSLGSDGASARGELPDEFVAEATLDLGEGITQVIDLQFSRKTRDLVRRTTAGTGAGR